VPLSPSRAERAALADLLETRGPDAPTLCGGWTTRDLAAHLVARDRRPDSLPGLGLRALAGWTERVRRQVREEHDYPRLVALVRAGAPAWSPVGNPLTEAAANTLELFVHHEDVRRARPAGPVAVDAAGAAADPPPPPRVLPAGLEDALWSRLRAGAGVVLRAAPTGVTLAAPGRREVRARSGVPVVTLRGTPAELTLYVSGRRAVAAVVAEGDPVAVRALADARLRI